MSSFLRSICQLMTSEEADGKTTIYNGQTDDDIHQTVLEASERRTPVHLMITPHDKSVGESCTSCQLALNELQLLRRRLQEECACKSLERSERRETGERLDVLSTNMDTASTKEDELYDVIDGLKLSLEKAKERQFGLQQQLIMERALRIEAIRMTEELQMKLTKQLSSHHGREENLSWEERNRLGANDDDDDDAAKTIAAAAKTTAAADQLQSLASVADKVDASYAKMEFVCSRCQQRERQTQTKTLPLHSIDRPPLRQRTAVETAGGGGVGRLAVGRPAAAGGFFPPPNSATISKAKSERISAVDDQRLSPDFHQKQMLSKLVMKPDSAGSDGILMVPTTKQDAGREPRIQDVIESRQTALLENSLKELRNIRNKETVKEFAKECSVSLRAGPEEEMSSIPLLMLQDSPSPSENLGQSKAPGIVLAADRNAKTLESKWSNSSSSITTTSRLPINGEKQSDKSKLQDDAAAKRSSKGKTATVTVSSNGSVTTYSGSNLSLWMQFGGGNEPEKIVAKQVKPYRLKKHQKQTVEHNKFIVEAATSPLRSSENQFAGQQKPRNKKELVFRRPKIRDFVDTDDTESCDQTIERQSTLFDMDIVRVYNHMHNDNQTPKETLPVHNNNNIESNKSSPSNSHQSSIFSKSTSIQSEIETQPAVRDQPRARNGARAPPPPPQENQTKRRASKSSAAAAFKEKPDDIQLVIDSVKEYCSFQIPVSLTASPDLDNSLNPDDNVPSDFFDSIKRAEKVTQTDTMKPNTSAADTRNAIADSCSLRCKAYRTYLETLAEKIQTRESMQSSAPPRFDHYDRRRQGKSTTATTEQLQSSCRTSRPQPVAEFSRSSEQTSDGKEPTSSSKLHFVTDESMITYLSGIRTNLQSKSYKNPKTSSNQTTDHVNPRCAVTLLNEEIIRERQQQFTSCGPRTQTVCARNQPTRIGTAPVPSSGADTCGIETMRRCESPTDDVFQTNSEAPHELDDQRPLATENAQIISNDIRHHYCVNIRPTLVDANLDKNPTTVRRLDRRILNLPGVDKAGGGSISSAAMSAADKEPMNDDDEDGGQAASQEEASSGPATCRVTQLKIMAANVEAPSVWVTKSPHDLLHASSRADQVLSSADSCETTTRRCECRSNKRGAAPSADCAASDTRSEEEEEDEDGATEESEATKHRHHQLHSTDDASSTIPSSVVSPKGPLAVVVVVAPDVSGAAGVGAATGGRDLDLLANGEQKPD